MPRPKRKDRLNAWFKTNVSTSLDQLFIKLAFRQGPRNDQLPDGTDMLELLEQSAEFYQQALRDEALFQAPLVDPHVSINGVRRFEEGEALDIEWPSGYKPLHPSYRSTLERCPETGFCHARWFRHSTPRPAIICLHGWGAGEFRGEAVAFPIKWMFNRCGLDVVLMNLPFHARRKSRQGRTPSFPSPMPPRTNEGFAQATHDIRTLISILLERGVPWCGVMGMSLGGFTSALMATVEPRLACVVPVIPFASLPVMIWEHSNATPSQRDAIEKGVNISALTAAMRATTPLLRQPVIDPKRILLIAGANDRITPAFHARMLHEHFDGSKLFIYPGGHLYQYGRREGFRRFRRFLKTEGLIG